MNTLSEFREALISDLNTTTNSSLFSETVLNSAINRAYIKTGGLFRWPQLTDAKETSTQKNIENYDAPTIYQYDSIYRLEVDGEQYGEDPDGSPMAFNDYLIWKDENPTSTDKKWSVHRNQFFIWPIPTTAGSYNISVWGLKKVQSLTDDADTTIFSYNMEECNEAIVLEAAAILRRKGEDDDRGQMASNEAKAILVTAYKHLAKEKAKYEKLEPFFEVDDMFGKSNTEQIIGNFY